MSRSRLFALVGAALAMSAVVADNKYGEYRPRYRRSGRRVKSILTPKQQKARAKAVRAKQARKINQKLSKLNKFQEKRRIKNKEKRYKQQNKH